MSEADFDALEKEFLAISNWAFLLTSVVPEASARHEETPGSTEVPENKSGRII